MASLFARLITGCYHQVQARKNLGLLRHPRAMAPFLGKTLLDAARTWPEVLPIKWRPRSVFDIGANGGSVSRALRELYHPEFIALIEPIPHLVTYLQGQTFAPRQKIFACAVGRTASTVDLKIRTGDATTSLLDVLPTAAESLGCNMDTVQTVSTPVRTIDSIYDECELSELDLLKIDIQGYELHAFAGGERTLERTAILVTEMSFLSYYEGQALFHDVYDDLRRRGFSLFGTFGVTVDPATYRPLFCDAVFLNLRNFGGLNLPQVA